jgi:hypothetical protein
MSIIVHSKLWLLLILVRVNHTAAADQSIEDHARVVLDGTSRMERSYAFRGFRTLDLQTRIRKLAPSISGKVGEYHFPHLRSMSV